MSLSSYPFLRIARAHGVDYGLTLRCADWFRRFYGSPLPGEMRHLQGRRDFWWEVAEACKTMEGIQRGEIDWLTGEPLAS